MPTIRLIHPTHGVVRQREFHYNFDSKKVLRCIQMWRHSYGRRYFECCVLWDIANKPNIHFTSLLKQHYDIVD